MTILILNSIVLISLAAAKLIFSGVQMSGAQSRSTKAYFAAEAGAERALWEWRKNGYVMPASSQNNVFSGVLAGRASYQVDYELLSPNVIFKSNGSFGDLRRRVEIELKF